jgi:YHS domain-containing protein
MGLIRWAILFLLVYCIYLLLRPRRPQKPVQGGPSEIPREGVMVQDPCCKTYIPQNQALKADVRGQIIHFCSQKCKDLYLESEREEQS